MFPTALRFGAQGTSGADTATVSSVGAIDGLGPWSLAIWFRVRTISGAGGLVIKGAGGTNNRRVSLTYSNTGRLIVALDRATTDLTYQSADGSIKPGQSYAAVATFNSGNSASDLVRFYLRSAAGGPPVQLTRATTTDGTGAFQSDAGVALAWGNNTSGGLVGQIDLYAGVLANVEWRVDEAQAILTGPWRPTALRGVLGAWRFGIGGSKAWDETGNGRHAAVSIATPLMRSWASPRKRWARVATAAAAAGGPFPWFLDAPLHGGFTDLVGGLS